MNWDVIKVKVTGDHKFHVLFQDGLAGEVVFSPESLFGVFEPLKDQNFFELVRVVNGTVSWPDDIDLAPDAMHEEIKKSGVWILV